MGNFERTSWPLGWIPADDANNGRVEGAVRFDNLTLDDKGVVSLIPGTKKISASAFPSTMYNIYSRYLNSKKYRYVHSGTSIYRNYGGAASLTTFDLGFLSGGNAQYSSFGAGFGHIFACSGTAKRKDNGTTQSDLGLAVPGGAPTLSVNVPPEIDVAGKSAGNFTNWDTAAVENQGVYNKASFYVEVDTNEDTLRGIAQLGLTTATTIDGTNLGGTGNHTDGDIFSAWVRVRNTSTFIKVRLEFLLKTPTGVSTTTDVSDYYYKEWSAEELRQGEDVWSPLTCARGDFIREGNDDSCTWATIKGVRVIFTASKYQDSCVLSEAKFQGGATGSLDGEYDYLQVNVQSTGTYLEVSPVGPISVVRTAKSASISITPYAVAASVNEVWIYRRNRIKGDGQFRGVKILTSSLGSAFNDIISDADLLLNTPGFDPRWAVANFDLDGVPDNCIGIEGPFFGRMIYATQSAILISEPNCPSLCDRRFVYENGSANGGSEINLFITKVSNEEILVGTTQDIYSFRGRGEESEDGTFLDFTLSPLGIKQPPIDWAFAVESNALLYHANDGWRVLAGSNSELITKDLDPYYKGKSAHGIDKVRIDPNNGVITSCCYGKGRILLCVEHTTNGRLIHSFNTITKSWELPYINSSLGALSLFTEEDGTVICASDTDKYLRELFIGTLFDEATKLPVQLTTAFDSNGAPFNRKDTSIFKITADSGNDNVTITIRADGSSSALSSTTLAFNGKTEKYIKIKDTVGKRKSFQVELSGNFGVFKLYGFSIEHEVLPKQEAFIRIPNTNLGNTGRKRFISFPIVIDSLGNSVTITPLADDVAYGTPLVISHTGKKTTRVWFTSEVLGTDLGVLIEAASGYFELYDIPWNEAVSEQMPSPTKYLKLSNDNLGTNARKRFNNVPFVLDPRGATVTVTPVLDGVAQTGKTFAGSQKATFVYDFTSGSSPIDVICTDLGLILSGTAEFEFHNLLKPKAMEVLPDPIKYLRTAEDNFGIYAYKQFNNLPFVMNSNGATVTVTPVLDGVAQTAQTFSSTYKKTHTYQFSDDVRAIDVALILSGSGYFEFYNLLKPQQLEIMPELVNFFRIPYSNFGTASKKRVRVIPLVINTFGANVTYTPIVDGISYTATTINTSRKQTVFHYFTSTQDIFGIDIGGTLDGASNFEFYGLEKPAVVEVLPIGKRFDQFGPIEMDRQGMIRAINLTLIAENSTISYRIYREDTLLLTSSFTATINKQVPYRISVPKGINASVFRMELYSDGTFYVIDAYVMAEIAGNNTDLKKVKIKTS